MLTEEKGSSLDVAAWPRLRRYCSPGSPRVSCSSQGVLCHTNISAYLPVNDYGKLCLDFKSFLMVL